MLRPGLMRLRHLRDVFAGQEIYIVGSGPTAEVFPMDFLADKVCLSLNDGYKIHPAITPVALMHHLTYCREGNTPQAPQSPSAQPSFTPQRPCSRNQSSRVAVGEVCATSTGSPSSTTAPGAGRRASFTPVPWVISIDLAGGEPQP